MGNEGGTGSSSGTSFNSWRTLDLGPLGPNKFFGRKKKKLDPQDFVSIYDGDTQVDLCHQKCSGRLIALLAFAWDVPTETWIVRSLKLQSGGVPIKHDLHCIICDSEDAQWIYEKKVV